MHTWSQQKVEEWNKLLKTKHIKIAMYSADK